MANPSFTRIGVHTPILFHVDMLALRASFAINLIFAVQLWGEPAAELPSPHTPQLHQTSVAEGEASFDVIGWGHRARRASASLPQACQDRRA